MAVTRSESRWRALGARRSITVKPRLPAPCDSTVGSSGMVGISLLTLVPRISGGSETYARELVLALARVGRLEYHVFAPTLAPDAVDGLPGTTVKTYPAAESMPGRIAAMALATAFPSRIRRELSPERLEALHFPLTITIPRGTGLPAATSVLDLQHELFPGFFSRAEL